MKASALVGCAAVLIAGTAMAASSHRRGKKSRFA